MLANLKASVPGLTWTTDEVSISITIWRSKNVDPLYVPVTTEVNRKFTALELAMWMSFVYVEDYGSFDSKQTCEMYILPGVTRRMGLNSFAAKPNCAGLFKCPAGHKLRSFCRIMSAESVP